MSTVPYAKRVTQARPSLAWRMRHAQWRQARHCAVCPAEPRLDGRLALITGGHRGIGLETTRGLVARGAEVISASRSAPAADVPARFVGLDLADLKAVEAAVASLGRSLGGRSLDLVVANAGLWPTAYARSPQGHEIAFATNALGHHALVRGLQRASLLADGARVIVVTGDIYVWVDDCTKDFTYRGLYGGQLAYCRSKLGNLWFARELARRHPELQVHAVHPGVIASELAGGGDGIAGRMKRAMMLSPEAGAQTSLYCATQPGLVSGSYQHNTLGRMELDPRDPAADDARARAFWDELEALSAHS